MSALGLPLRQTELEGVVIVSPPFHQDRRGAFTKPFSPAVENSLGIPFDIVEVYWSRSVGGTVRGMHFQVPPTPIGKVVFSVEGRVRDIVLDLRVGSATYLRHTVIDLAPGAGAVYVPHGCAHGFEVVDESATLVYLQDGAFDPATDAGVRWDTFGATWQTPRPVLSDRDSALPALEDFVSPFREFAP